MFEVLSWSYRLVYLFLAAAFCACSYLVFFKNKPLCQYLLPVINILLTGSAFALISYYEKPADLNAVYTAAGFTTLYLISRQAVALYISSGKLLLFDAVFHLQAVGLMILYRLSAETGLKQFTFSVLGNLVFFIAYFLLKRCTIHAGHTRVLAVSIFVLLILTQLFGVEIFGSKNWINFGSFYFQPSELLKLAFVFWCACMLEKPLDARYFAVVSLHIAAILAFFALQRDLGSAFIFFTVYLVMLFSKDKKFVFTAVSGCCASLGGISSYFALGYIRSRVLAWVDPWKYVSNKSYQITQSLFAVATGGLIGTGLLLGDPKYIPAVSTDFIFSALCEETGVAGGILLLAVFGLITLIGMHICLECRSSLYQSVALGLTSMTAIQTLIIVCGVLNLIPITGVTLPFVSYGGSSILSQYANLGILYYIWTKANWGEPENQGDSVKVSI